MLLSEEDMLLWALVAKRFSKDELKDISLDFIAARAIPTSVIRDSKAKIIKEKAVNAATECDPDVIYKDDERIKNK
jgi:hypothetical protein